MKFTIYGENVSIRDEMRSKIEDKLSFLSKYVAVDDDTTARVTVKKYENSLKIEVTIPTKVGLMRSEIVHDNFENGIDLAIDKIEDQIRKQKSRLSRRHKESLASSFVEDNGSEADVPVRTKTVYAEEMVLDEAIMRMEMLSHSFFVYKDVDSGSIALVYKRNDGQYGLLEIKE
ncbi:MAG: ribosome-associated translation inhibitor RaiA [Erysipelotrichaceae bacterium]|nr:ribosome-associated translation inhibitor RaiA [Erysipelotrichaceae bacterium]